jgi:predicted DNA-binding mobile mystery protein A
MTTSQFAKRLGITRPSVYDLEADEMSGGASLDRLRRAAAALNCRLVYALVPENSLEETVRRQALKQAKNRLGRVNVSQALEASAVDSESLSQQVDDLATELMVNRPSSLWNERS